MAPIYRSEAFASIHETAVALHEVGVMSSERLREFDASCLAPADQAEGSTMTGQFTNHAGEVRELRHGDIKLMRPMRDVLPVDLQNSIRERHADAGAADDTDDSRKADDDGKD